MPPEIVAFAERTNGLCVMALPDVWPEAEQVAELVGRLRKITAGGY